MSDAQVRFGYTGSALPGNAEVVVLLATAPTSGVGTGVIAHPAHSGLQFQKMGIRRILIGLTNDQAGTIDSYQSLDRGATWNKVSTTAVAASAANSENLYDFLVEEYYDWKAVWVNGATPQTTWRVNIVGTGQRVIAN